MTRQKGLIVTAFIILVMLLTTWGAATYIEQITQALGAPIAEATQAEEQNSRINVYPISPRKAALIALRVMPRSSTVEGSSLVSFGGAAAYEVQLDSGIVYVDAISGQVLYDGAEAPGQEPTPLTIGE